MEELVVVSLMYAVIVVIMRCNYKTTKTTAVKVDKLEDRVQVLEQQFTSSNASLNKEQELSKEEVKVLEELIEELMPNKFNLSPQNLEENSIKDKDNYLNRIEEAGSKGIRGLKKLASEVKLPKYSKMTKAELYSALLNFMSEEVKVVEV